MNDMTAQKLYALTEHATQTERVYGVNDLAWFLRFAWPRILVGSVLVASLGVVYLSNAPRTYTATASVIFEPSTGPNFDANSRWLEPSAEMTTRIESQVEVIKSEQIASAVVVDQKLADDREFIPKPGMLERVKSLVGMPEIRAAPPTQDEMIDLIASGLLRQLSLRRVGLSAVIEVSFTASDPQKASRIANAFIEAYVQSGLKQKAAAARGGSVWLQDRLQELRTKAFDALRDAELFKRQAGGEVSDSTVRLAELESVAQAYRRLYENFFLKFAETLQRISYPVTDARLVSAATPAAVTSAPNSKMILAFATGFGALLGGMFALAQIALDRRIRDRRIVSENGINLLGTVTFDSAMRSSAAEPDGGSRTLSGRPLAHALQRDALADLRAVHVDVRKAMRQSTRRIGIVSIGQGAGATTIAAKLAQYAAAIGDRVVVLDANVEHPCLTDALAADAGVGVIDLLRGTASGEATLREVPQSGFCLVPLVKRADVAATPGLSVNTAGGQERLDKLLTEFDTSIVDLSSMPQSLEARLVAPALDGVVVVVEFGRTRVDEVQRAIAELARNGASVLGVVINKCPAGLRV